MSYQTFHGEGKGHSDSIAKLNSLGFPARFDNLSYLDIGCNEGFFCFEAKRRGAAVSVGIDTHPPYIENAKDRAARYGLDVDFRVGSVFSVEGQFDYILVASVLHYIKDPILFFRKVHSLLKPGGTLLLEVGVSDTTDDLCRVFRDDTDYVFPSATFLTENWLRDFDAAQFGKSVSQEGDPVARWVYHCTKTQSIYLAPTSARDLSKVGGQRINADQFFLPDFPRSMHNVPEQQKVIFEAAKTFERDVVLTFKNISTDRTVFDYVVDMIEYSIRFQGGSKHTFVEGRIIPFIADALSARFNPAEGFRVYFVKTPDAEGHVGKTSALDVQTTKGVVTEISRAGHQAWAERYLLQNRTPNRALFDLISTNSVFWLGPIDIPVGSLVERAGPGREFHEDQEVWDSRVEQIMASVSDAYDWPPAIAYHQISSDGSSELVLADGSHRNEAFKRLGLKTMPVVVWFDTEEQRRDYTTTSS